jgi:NitT/TauT family transport system substrate-binding protein
MVKFKYWLYAVLILVVVGSILIIDYVKSPTAFVVLNNTVQSKAETLVYAEPITLGNTLISVAMDEGFFEEEGIKVVSQKFSAGRLALDAVLTNNAHFSSMSETPFMLSVLQGNDLIVIATVAEHKETKAIARKDKGILNPHDIYDKKIGTLPGTNSDYFMYNFLEANGIKQQDVQIVSMPPPEMVSSLTKGDIDAFFAWEPYIYFAKKELPNNTVTFEPGDLYDGMKVVLMQRSFVNKNPESVKKIIRALLKAETFVKQNREKAIEIDSNHTGISREALKEIYDEYHLEVNISQKLIELLDKEAEWAISSGISKATEKPDFKNFLYTTGLKEADSERVNVE